MTNNNINTKCNTTTATQDQIGFVVKLVGDEKLKYKQNKENNTK